MLTNEQKHTLLRRYIEEKELDHSDLIDHSELLEWLRPQKDDPCWAAIFDFTDEEARHREEMRRIDQLVKGVVVARIEHRTNVVGEICVNSGPYRAFRTRLEDREVAGHKSRAFDPARQPDLVELRKEFLKTLRQNCGTFELAASRYELSLMQMIAYNTGAPLMGPADHDCPLETADA